MRNVPQPAHAAYAAGRRGDVHDVSRQLAHGTVSHGWVAPSRDLTVPNVPRPAPGEGGRERLRGLSRERAEPDEAAATASVRYHACAPANQLDGGRADGARACRFRGALSLRTASGVRDAADRVAPHIERRAHGAAAEWARSRGGARAGVARRFGVDRAER